MNKKTSKKVISPIKKEWKNIMFNCIFAFFTLLIPIILKKNLLLTIFILLIISIIGLLKWKSKITFAIFLFGAIFGSVSEMIGIGFGIWNYSLTNFINIPLWLFITWGNASAFIYQTAIEFERLGVHK